MKRKPILNEDDGVSVNEDADVVYAKDDGILDGISIDDDGFLQNGVHWPTVEILRHVLGVVTSQASEFSNDAKESLDITRQDRDVSDEDLLKAEKQASAAFSGAKMVNHIKKFVDTTLIHSTQEILDGLLESITDKRKEGKAVVADINVFTGSVEDAVRENREAINLVRGRDDSDDSSGSTTGWTRVDKRKMN